MALYSGAMELADAVAAPLKSEREDGLWATVIVDEQERALGLAWSDLESLREAFRQRRGIYHSRRRGLWIKGETSGDTQELLRVDLDCDRDALRFVVRQRGRGFCHEGTWTCWGEDRGLPRLLRRLRSRLESAPEGSYTRRLFEEEGLLAAKLREEAKELSEAKTDAEVVHEAADVLYFTLVAMAKEGVDLRAVEEELERRSLRLTRRRGDAKEER
jgi:phosphoribosyl-AMP cyclohydrolase / phosphoribosyl-ATP pyrophosphohydrolase